MITILEKLEELKERMDFFGTCQKRDEIDLLLTCLEQEIKSFKEVEIYKEDFSHLSWSYISKNNNIICIKAYIKET
jgi:hypothetical protein